MSITRTVLPRITAPGIYDIPHDVYLADPVIEASLNNSTAKVLVGQSPLHAWAQHPRLGMAPDDDGESTEALDVGHIAHEMFLLGESAVRVLNVSDFRTAKAKDLRDQAIADGKIPLKAERYDAVQRIVEKLERFRLRTGAFTEGKAEQTLVWTEGRRWSRAKVDWLPDEPEAYLWDLKTISGRANVQTFGRSAFDFGYDLASAYYPRGAECVRGLPPEGMRFCVIETKAPFGIRVFEFSPAAMEEAYEEIMDAIRLWDRCMETATWPEYPDDVEWIDAPPWKLKDRAWRRQRRQAPLTGAIDPKLIADMERAGNLGG